MSAPTVRPPLLIALYNHNPFYVISVLLMLYAVRSAYGELEVGTINTGLMMGVLAGYTSLLAAIAVLIIRKGKVWEDAARSSSSCFSSSWPSPSPPTTSSSAPNPPSTEPSFSCAATSSLPS